MYDTREFAFGSVWTITDELVGIPDADRDGSRVIHPIRVVLVVSNNQTNADPLTPIISIAPLSHRVGCIAYGDVPLSPDRDGVRTKSIVRTRLIQPALKADLLKHVATISEDACEEVLLMIEEFFGLELPEE
jgi:mRNA-degrading endonuclease toxin of MazEF toxin-antitoxin module